MRRRALPGVVVLGAALPAVVLLGSMPAADAARAPAALVAALRSARVGKLPHGYAKPAVGTYEVTAAARRNHAVGGVQVVADRGREAIVYIVFATAADAKRDWENADFTGAKTSAAPASLPKPSVVVTTTSKETSGATTIEIGLTDVAVLSGNVIVQGVTSSVTNPKHGSLGGSVALARFALAHLRALR